VVYSSNPPTITRNSRSGTVKTWAQLEPWGGAILKWTDDKSGDRGLTVWHVAEKNTEWFSPSPSSFMINYHIDNMAEMLAELQRNGVEILRGPESDENGKFAWILDPDETKSNFGSRCRGMKNNKAK
jgi:predicted enzyme related to lactoylglutathione lyase